MPGVVESGNKDLKIIIIGAGKCSPGLANVIHQLKPLLGSTGLLIAQGLKQVC